MDVQKPTTNTQPASLSDVTHNSVTEAERSQWLTQRAVALKNMAWLGRVAALITVVVIALGAYTRLEDAGLGCPDWPGCYGQLTVPSGSDAISVAEARFPERPVETHKAWLEMIHRYAASTLGLVILGLGYLGWRMQGTIRKTTSTLVVMVLLQGALGAWTVTLKLWPVIVMLHLLGGFTVFTLLVLLLNQIYYRRVPEAFVANPKARHRPRSPLPTVPVGRFKAIHGLGIASIAVLIGQILLGGWTSSNYAALMCTSLPVCNGEWTQYLDFKNAFNLLQLGFENYEYGVLEYPARMTIHVTHRFGAMVTSVVMLAYILRVASLSMSLQRRELKVCAILMGAFLLLQIGLGIINVVMSLPLLNAVAHNVVASLLLVTTVSTAYRVHCHLNVAQSETWKTPNQSQAQQSANA